MRKTIVCFANSRKGGGHCFAGIDLNQDKWIRPITSRESKSLLDYEECVKNVFCPNKDNSTTDYSINAERKDICEYCNPEIPGLLDIVEVNLSVHIPYLYQIENYLIENNKWILIGKLDKSEIDRFIDNSNSCLWVNVYQNWHRRNNRIPEELCSNLCDSLRLIEVPNLKVIVELSYERNKPNVVNGYFIHNRVEYILPITDMRIEKEFINKPQGEYIISKDNNRIILCISIGLPFEGYIYKFISGLIII